MAGALLGADRSASNWQLLLEGGGILLTEDTAAKTLVEGLNEKESEAGITLSVDPSTAYATVFAPVDKNFCSRFDQAIVELAPNFLDVNEQPFAGDLEVLANLVGDEHVVTYQSDGSPLEPYKVSISSAYITQRFAMLNLFVTPAMDIYSMSCIVKSAKVILPTEKYMEDQDGTWSSQDVTIATMSNDVVTVVSDGVCKFEFEGTDPTNSGTITAYCLLEPDVNVVKNCASARPYSSTDTAYGVTIQMSNQGVLTLNGTMTQNAEFTVSPLANGYQVPTYFDCSDIEGNLLLWCEELGGSCTVPSGRVYIDFCSKHPSSSNVTVSEYQIELYNTSQIAQYTHAKLIHNDTKNIYGIRIFASSGTVFNNYQIRIGIKKYPTNGQVYNFGLLEPYMLAPNAFAQYMGNGPHTRVCDGSFSFFGLDISAAVYRYSHSYTSTQFGPATIVTGDQITEVGKAYRFTVQIVEKPENTTTMFKNAPAYFNLYYSDGTIAATINLTSEDQFRNDIASTSFISEKVVDFLGLATIKGATMQGRFRVAFNLKEINVDDLDLENLTLYTDSKIVNQQDIKIVYEPAAIVGSPTASALIWSSSDDEIATVDENGHITVHSDGECTFTATSVKTPSISASVTAMCYYAQDDNMVANLVKISQATYSQGGITIKHNADGTITFNGTTTNSNTTYYRNVIWPLGNNKTVWNVFFPRQGISGTWLLWWEYVSGSIEGTSTFTGGSVSHELYVINHSGTEILKIQAKYTSPDDTDREKYCKSMTTNDGIRLVSWGFQMAKGTKFNNYTVRVGIKKFANLDYHGGVLEEFLCALTGYKKFATNKSTIWTRFPDGSIGGYLDESTTAFPSASGYVRLTKELTYANNVSSILTGDKIGIAGHNYRLDVNLIKFKYDRIAATELKFGVAYADGTPAGEITIIDPATFVSSGTNIDLRGTTYSTTFQAAEQLDCAYQYFNQLKVKGKEEYFAISLSDLDTMIVAYGQTITVTENDIVPEDITVNYGGRLNVSSGITLPKVTENGGYVRIDQATVAFVPNTITDLEITGKNSATLHSGTVLESSIINGNSAFVDVSSGGSCVDTTITSGGRMYVYGDGIASNIEVNEGSLSVNARADVFDITLNSGAALVVSNYGTVSNVVVNPGASLTGYQHGNYYNITENGGYFSLSDNQNIATSVIAPNHVSGVSTDKYTAHSGTTLTDITGNSGYVYNSGIVNSTTLHYTNELSVSSGGTALNIVENGGSFWHEEGAVYTIASNTITGSIGSGCWNGITVHSNTVVSDATVIDDYLAVYSGGVCSNVTLIDDGEIYISSGGFAGNVSAIEPYCYIFVEHGGYASSVRLSSGGRIEVSSGGTALDAENVPFTGLVISHAGATVTFMNNLSGVYYGNVGQIASHADSLYTPTINSRFEVYSGGVINIGAMRTGGYLQVNSGGIVSNVRFVDNCNIDIMNGGKAYNTSISTGVVYIYDGGYASNVTITTLNGTDRAMIISSGGTLAGSVDIGGSAKILLRSGAIVNYDLQGITPAASARMNCSGLFDADASPVFNAIVTSNNVNGSYKLAIPASTFEQYPVNVYQDGISAGAITLEDSLIVNDKEFSLSVSGNTLMFTQATYIPPVSGTIVNAGETLTVLPDERYIDNTINSGGSMIVSSNGHITSTVVNYGATLDLIGSDAVIANAIIENGGYVNTRINNNNDGIGFASNTFSGLTINHNSTTVHSGTTATDIIVDDQGSLQVKRYGVANNVVVNPWGHLSAFANATVTSVVENGGNVSAHESASVTYVPNTFTSKHTANCTIHSGNTGIGTFIDWGNMYIFDGGTAINTIVSHGSMYVFSGAVADHISTFKYGRIEVLSGATATNLSAHYDHGSVTIYADACASNLDFTKDNGQWGSIKVLSGGTITGIIKTSATYGIIVSSGGIINFDLTSRTPDNETLLSPMSRVNGQPTYILTLSDTLSSGVYNLADGLTSEGFSDMIYIQNTSGNNVGSLGMNIDYDSNGRRHYLTASEGALTMGIGEWDLIIDNDSKVGVSGSYGNVLVKYGNLSCYAGTTIDNLQVMYRGYVTANNNKFTISNCTEHGGAIETNTVIPYVKQLHPNHVSGLSMIFGKNIQVHSGTTITDLVGPTSEHSGYVRIYSGGTLIHPAIQGMGNGGFQVFSGGVVISPTWTSNYLGRDMIQLLSGATALAVNWDDRSKLSISSGAYVEWVGIEAIPVSDTQVISTADTSAFDYLVMNTGSLTIANGGAVNSVNVMSNGALIIESGASLAKIDNAGKLTISSGASINNPYISSGGTVWIKGTATSVTKHDNPDTVIYISSGGLMTAGGNIFKGSMYVSSGGSLTDGYLGSVRLSISAGATVSNIGLGNTPYVYLHISPDTYVNYSSGQQNIQTSNGYISGYVCNASTYLYISSGGTAVDTTIDSNGTMTIYSGGTGSEITLSSGGTLVVYSGGTTADINNLGGVIIGYFSSGEKAIVTSPVDTKYHIASGGGLTVMNGGVVSDATINLGSIYVSSGGVANNTVINGGLMYVYSGTVTSVSVSPVSSGNVVNGATIQVDGGVANNVLVSSACGMYVYYGGVVNSTTIYSGGTCRVSSNGSVNNAVVYGGMYVSSGCTLSNVTVSSGGYLYVSSGGTALNVTYTPTEGYITVLDGGYITYNADVEYIGIYYGSNGVLQSHTNSMSDKNVTKQIVMEVFNSGIATNTKVSSGGSVKISSGGIISNTTINTYGRVYVNSGGTANIVNINSGGSIIVNSGGTATSISAANVSASLKFTIDTSTYVTWSRSGSSFTFVNGSCANCVLEGSDYLAILSNCTVDNISIKSCASASISSGGFAGTIQLNNASNWIYVNNGATVNSIIISSGSGTVSEGGVVSTFTQLSGSFGVGGIVSDAIIHAGSMVVSSGGTALNIKENGGAVYTQSGAVAVFNSHTFSNVTIKASATIHSNTVAQDIIIASAGRVYIYSGGIVESATVELQGSTLVSSGGTAAIKENGGYVWVDDEASATFIPNTISGLVFSTNWMYTSMATIHSGTVANDITIVSGFNVKVYPGGICSNVLLSNCVFEISSGGTAFNVDYNPMDNTNILAHEGAYVTYVSQYSGVIYTSNGSRSVIASLSNVSMGNGGITVICATDDGVVDTVDMSAGRIIVRSEGIVRNVSVHVSNNAAYLSAYDGGLFENISMSNNLMGYCTMYLNPGASASNIDVGPATHLSIFSGAIATDIVENGGNVDVAEGATVTFASNTFGNIGSDISTVTVHSNTTLSGAVLQGYPGWSVSCMIYGGTVKDTEITANYMYVSDGYMSNVTISGGYSVQLDGSRLTVSDITFRSGNTYLIGGSFTNIHISAWTLISGDVHINGVECAGFLQLLSGTVNNLNIDSTCTVLVNTNGIVSNVNIYTGYMICGQGCTVNSVTIHENGQLVVSPCAIVSNIVIESNGELFVSSGASALNVISNTGGVISAHADAYITYA